MKLFRRFSLAVLAAAVAGFVPLSAQEPAAQSSLVRQTLEKIVQQEHDLVKSYAGYSPRVETYVQEIHTNKDLTKQIVSDDYFLGRLDAKNNVTERTFLPSRGLTLKGVAEKALLYRPIANIFSFQIQPGSFADPIFIDPQNFDLAHYDFEFAGREFLGQVRCLVFNVRPRAKAGAGLFEGRMWVEDQGYHIVRFNGDYEKSKDFPFHFDSWRENIQPGLWLPVYVYSEETDLARYGVPHLGFRAQTRLWGYILKATTPDQELTQILVDSKTPIEDASTASHDNSPLESSRDWRREAETNALSRLQKGGLMAPVGPVDKVLETVVNNLIVTNHLDNLPAVHCRVMMTYPLESFTIGDTIVLSRGLVDVLPDEASLAMVLGHELAHIVLGDTVDTKYAFYDRMMISDEQLLKTFDFAHSTKSEDAADQEAVKLLQNSPYKDKLGKAGLFLKALSDIAPDTPSLFGAHLGTRLIDKHQQLRMAQLLQGAPKLEPNSVDQIAALPLGARVKVDSWDDSISLMKSKPVNLISAKDKMPFEVTPLIPYLVRYNDNTDQQRQAQR
ncbi:MAG TPA: M48 family metalloprotease [Terriglobales bacterium]|nr:M48 family metalloprotease [Terriglobales bacterium]